MERIDTQAIGFLAQEFMEGLEKDYSDYDDAEVGVVAIVAEITYVENGEQKEAIEYLCTDLRRWIQRALFYMAEEEAASALRSNDD